MDEINTEALRRELITGSEIAKKVCTFFSTSNQFAFQLKIKRKLEAIKQRLAVIRDDRHFHLETTNEDAKHVYRSRSKLTRLCLKKKLLVGMKIG